MHAQQRRKGKHMFCHRDQVGRRSRPPAALNHIQSLQGRKTTKRGFAITIGVALLCGGSGPALAGGVKKIKQPRSFPIIISAPGSYRLNSNLDVTATGQANPENLDAIQITAEGVTLDLAGFQIKGPTVCTGAPWVTSCAPLGTGRGIFSSANVTIMNGAVTGMGNNGIEVGSTSSVKNLNARSNGNYGIHGGGTMTGSTAARNGARGINWFGSVSHCAARENGGPGIVGSLVSDGIATFNRGDGISADSVSNSEGRSNFNRGITASNVLNSFGITNGGAGIDGLVVTHSTAIANSGDGITGSAVIGNVAQFNTGFGIRVDPGGSYTQNNVQSNTGGTITGGLSQGQNVCNGIPGC
jgi:hypothetical protein